MLGRPAPAYSADRPLQRAVAYSLELGFWYPLTDGQMEIGVGIADGYLLAWTERVDVKTAGVSDRWSDRFDVETALPVPAGQLMEADTPGLWHGALPGITSSCGRGARDS